VLVTLGTHVGHIVLVTSKVDADRTIVVFGHLDGVEERRDKHKIALVFDQGAQYFFSLRGRRQGERVAKAPAKICVSRYVATTFVVGGLAVDTGSSLFTLDGCLNTRQHT
jgi:hypothetical protein